MARMRAPPFIALPDPCLVILVGAAGSGKSTFAARHFSPSEVLSSDAFRELVSGDPGDQAATGAAFAALHAALAQRLGNGLLTVVDATSVQTHARRQLTRRAAEAGVPAVAVVLDLPGTLVLARNAARPNRVVPEAAVRRQLAELDRSLRAGHLETEGFASVVRLTSAAAVDAARVARAG
jgi:protein phosphatase